MLNYTTSASGDKASIRQRMVAFRKSLSETAKQEKSSAIARYLMEMHEVAVATHVHLYLPIGALGEVNTMPFIEQLTLAGKQLMVPVVHGIDLLSAHFHSGDKVCRGAYGQLEPAQVQLADETDIRVMVLPMLAFDEQGYRLGYGKGYYDRFLQRLAMLGVKPFRIGIAFAGQQVTRLHVDPWDEPLDAVVHEQGIVRYF